MITSQPFVLIPSPPDVIGLHYTDTHLLACAGCKQTISNGTMEHNRDCPWLAAVVLYGTNPDS